MGLGARALREPHSGVTPKSGQTKQSSRQSRVVRRPLSYKRAYVRKLFHRLDGWLVRRIWSHRFGKWRCCGWTTLPLRKLYGEFTVHDCRNCGGQERAEASTGEMEGEAQDKDDESAPCLVYTALGGNSTSCSSANRSQTCAIPTKVARVSSVAIVCAIARHSRARRRYSFALLVTIIVLFARNVTIVRVPKFKTGHCQIQKGPQGVKGGWPKMGPLRVKRGQYRTSQD
jgi:hypothetical protein